jgi:branched-chain amino acid transport system substrate-binding protein
MRNGGPTIRSCGNRDLGSRTFGFHIPPSSRSILFLLALAFGVSAAEQLTQNSGSNKPFLRLRDTTLGYHGPSSDFTNITEIRVGWFGPTNLDDPLNGDLWWSANWAIQEANKSGRLSAQSSFHSLPFRLIPCWSVDPWGTGVSQLTRMVYQEQPLALLGSVDSASTHLAEQIAAKANLPLLSPVATDKSITLAGVSWMFCCAPSDPAIARTLVDGMVATRDGRLALITCTDHESRMTAREVLREMARRSRMPDLRLEVVPGAAALKAQLDALSKARPATLVVVAGPEDAARIVRAVHNLFLQEHQAQHFPVAVFGTHTMSRQRFRELAGAAAEGVHFPLLLQPHSANTATGLFVDTFTQSRGHAPDYAAVLAYDATRLLIEAVRRAGPNRARIRDTLAQLSPWSGLAGEIHFDGTGQNTRSDLLMGTIRDGALMPLGAAKPAGQRAGNF